MESLTNNSAIASTLDEINLCVRCGSCKAHCPTYTETAREGMSARGRIALLKELFTQKGEPSRILDERIFSCMLCGACEQTCPLGIKVTDAVYEGRRRLRAVDPKKRLLGLFIKYAFKETAIAYGLLKLMNSLSSYSTLRKYAPFKTIGDLKLSFPESALRDEHAYLFKASRPKARIALFAGCTVNYLFPSIGKSIIKTLNSLNYDVILPKGESCCGAPQLSFGLKDEAGELAARNTKIFRNLNVEAVIGFCPTCIDFIKNTYPSLIGVGIDNAVDVSQFFQATGDELSLKAERGSTAPKRILYHDPCHALYKLKLKQEPRMLLRAMGFEVVEPKEQGCCGFGGPFKVLYQDLSGRILDKRIAGYTGADTIVTSCPNCILQFKSKMRNRQIKHISEVIGEHTL